MCPGREAGSWQEGWSLLQLAKHFKLSSLPGDDIFLTLSPKSLAPHSGPQMHVPIPPRPLLILYVVPLQRAGENCTFYRRCTYSGKEGGEWSFKYKTAGRGEGGNIV